MLRAGVNLVLFLAALALAAANLVVRPSPAHTNFEFIPQMVHQPRYNAFAPNPNFADGKTLQPPAPGTISRGHLPLHYAATPVDALRAGAELLSPVTADNQNARQRGAIVFANFCVECHGAGGLGNGAITQRGYPPPPSLLAERALKMRDGQMFHILTYGQNNMPSYASQVSRQDRWNVIAYVRTLQAQAAAPQPATSLPAPATPTVQKTALQGHSETRPERSRRSRAGKHVPSSVFLSEPRPTLSEVEGEGTRVEGPLPPTRRPGGQP